MLEPFSPTRQKISRAIESLRLGWFFRGALDWCFYSWFRYLDRRRIEKLLRESPESESNIAKLSNLMWPKVSDCELVRVGNDSDGGYLIPLDWIHSEALFSPGVAGSSKFELAFAERGIPCFLLDGSVEAPPQEHLMFSFKKLFLGFNGGPNWITLPDWIAQSRPNLSSGILQMDIEGHEWETLLNSPSQDLDRFDVMIVEFHNLERILLAEFGETYFNVLEKLHLTHFPVHAHANNYSLPLRISDQLLPRTIEVTWLKKSKYKAGKNKSQFLIELDRKNNPRFREIDLSFFFKSLSSQKSY